MKYLNRISIGISILALILGGGYLMRREMRKDVIPPEITMESDIIECSVSDEEEKMLDGITASDDKDGDITDRIMIDSIRIRDKDNNPNGNEFDIRYVVFDSSNNMNYASRTLVYSDYSAPKFQLFDDLVFSAAYSSSLYTAFQAEDCVDGDISNQISIELKDPSVSTLTFGSYDFTVSATNSLGDTSSMDLTFRIEDMSADDAMKKPLIYLSEYLVYVKAGSKINPKQYLSYVKIDQTTYEVVESSVFYEEDTQEYNYGYSNSKNDCFVTKDMIQIKNNVNTEEPGVYKITYSMKHPAETAIGTTDLIVVVE